MIAWMFETVWHALFGLVMLAGVFVGAVVVVGRALATGAEHNPAKCNCWDCKDRRVRAVQKSQDRARAEYDHNSYPANNVGLWISTLELLPEMRVRVKDEQWEVRSIQQRKGQGYTVFLRNCRTRRETMVAIKAENATKPYWRRVRIWE